MLTLSLHTPLGVKGVKPEIGMITDSGVRYIGQMSGDGIRKVLSNIHDPSLYTDRIAVSLLNGRTVIYRIDLFWDVVKMLETVDALYLIFAFEFLIEIDEDKDKWMIAKYPFGDKMVMFDMTVLSMEEHADDYYQHSVWQS